MDGVLADFDTSYQKLLCEFSQKTLPEGFKATEWNWESAAGFSKGELDRTWEEIKSTPFWFKLKEYPETRPFLEFLYQELSIDSYFITSRVGKAVHAQTRNWLYARGFPSATVLISSEKGLCCKALKLDFYLDDRRKNVIRCAEQSPETRTFLLDRPWNQGAIPQRVERITSLYGYMEAIHAAVR